MISLGHDSGVAYFPDVSPLDSFPTYSHMPYPATVFNVMIASPGDVLPERNLIRDVIHEWNAVNSLDRNVVLMPVGWETHSTPEMGDRPQEIINKQILQNADLLIGVFWTRLGTPTGEATSGTVEEIEEHVASGKPAMIYFSLVPVRPDSVDESQYSALKEFKSELQEKGLYETYESLDEFRDKLIRNLSSAAITYCSPDLPKSDDPESLPEKKTVTISDEATDLLLAASTDAHGIIIHVRSSSGLCVQTAGKNFVPTRNARVEASWDAAVRELVRYGLIQSSGGRGETYKVTAQGYIAADHIKERRSGGN